MAVIKKVGHWILDEVDDEIDFEQPTYIKYVAFETADATADGTFSLVDALEEDNIVPKYTFVDADDTPPAQFAVENFVSDGVKVEDLPDGGRIFVYHGRRP